MCFKVRRHYVLQGTTIHDEPTTRRTEKTTCLKREGKKDVESKRLRLDMVCDISSILNSYICP